MKIRGWHIEGFGIHRDWRVDDLPGGLEVFYGPNEAGKSTLLAFLRGVLFKFPDRRTRENRYEPIDGVPHGGRVTLESAGARVVVERFVGPGKKVAVTLEDGQLGGEDELAERLGRVDGELYKNVFAFGLRELQELGALEKADVQDHLFAAGVTGGGRPAREAVRKLDERARQLFDGLKGRKKDQARAIVARIAEAKGELYLRQELAETYPALRDRIEGLESTLAEQGAKAATARQVEQRAARLVELWNEVWCPLAEAREQAAKLAPALSEALPADAGERLEAGRAAVQRAEEHLDLVRGERSSLARQLEDLRLDEGAFAVAARVEGLQARRALDASHGDRLATLEGEREACEARIRAAIGQLFGASEDEAALRAVHSTPQRREELRAWKGRLDEATHGVREPEAASRVVAGQLDSARVRLAETAQRADAVPEVDRGELERRTAALRAVRALAPRLREAEGELAAATASLASEEAGAVLLPGRLAAVLLVGLAASVAIGVFFWVGRPELALATAALVTVVGATRFFRMRAANRVQDASRRQAHDAALAAGLRVEALRAEAAPHLALLFPADGASVEAALGDEAALARAEDLLREERDRWDAGSRLREELREARNQVARLEVQHQNEAERLERGREVLDSRLRGFGDWKSEAGVPEELGVDAALEFLEEVRHGRSALDDRDRIRAEIQRLSADRLSFRGELDAVLELAGPPGAFVAPADDAGRFEAFERLCERCAADRRAREGRDPLERRGVELRTRFAECEAGLESARAVLQALVVEAGAADLPALERSLGLAADAAALQSRVAQGETELARRLETLSEEEASFLRAELERGSVAAWEEQAVHARAKAASIGLERDAVLRDHQDCSRDRTRLEESTEVIDLELRKGALEQQLREVLEEWRRVRVAAQLLEESIRRFEEAHQPGVLREASALFAEVTGGRYPRIVRTESGAGFAVLTAEGTHRSPAELSQGTTEQLYLCIRLGLVAEMARNGRQLPVVMDDVLVNFDDERAAAMAEVLGAFAGGHQVLFFTCSSRTRDLLARAPNASLNRIGGA